MNADTCIMASNKVMYNRERTPALCRSFRRDDSCGREGGGVGGGGYRRDTVNTVLQDVAVTVDSPGPRFTNTNVGYTRTTYRKQRS